MAPEATPAVVAPEATEALAAPEAPEASPALAAVAVAQPDVAVVSRLAEPEPTAACEPGPTLPSQTAIPVAVLADAPGLPSVIEPNAASPWPAPAPVNATVATSDTPLPVPGRELAPAPELTKIRPHLRQARAERLVNVVSPTELIILWKIA